MVAVAGDYDDSNRLHRATDAALEHLGLARQWVPTLELDGDAAARLAGFDAVWCAPGSPYRSMAGALAAIRHARERGLPFTGT